MTWKIDEFLRSEAAMILHAFGDAVSIQDTSLNILYQNNKHIQLMGDQVGKKCYAGYQQRAAVCPDCHLLRAFKEKRTVRRTGSSHHSRRGLCHVEITSFPLLDAAGAVVAGIEAVRDITEQKQLDERLRLITCDLEQKTWKLMAANRELESFNYTLSHDVRNYLSRISVAADALTNEVAASGDGSTGPFLINSIIDSVASLDELIDAILRLSSAGLSGIAKDDVDMGSLAKEVTLELCSLYPEHTVDLTIGAGLDIKGDSQLLKVMLRNLFGNAWKYTLPTPAARVSFTAEEHDGKTIFVIRDNGVGFDMKESSRLFKPFSRLSNSAGLKGSGIGLATARRVILCHGGEMWAAGEPGKGAAFFFSIPLAQG